MLVRRAAGVLYVVTALISGYWETSLTLRPLIGGPWSWWYVIALGGSVILLAGGVHALAPRLTRGLLVTLVSGVSLALWGLVGGSSGIWLAFTLATALAAWGALALAAALRKWSVVGIIAAAVSALFWVPASVRTLGGYFSPATGSPDPVALLWVLAPGFLIIASIVAGLLLCRSAWPGSPEGYGQSQLHRSR